MKQQHCVLLAILVIVGCGRGGQPQQAAPAKEVDLTAQFLATLPKKAESLVAARKALAAKLTRKETANEPVPAPPPELFTLTNYDSPGGKLAAYVSPDPKDGKKHPAIIWITGGDCNTIGDVWEKSPEDNEQSASAYRKAGILMMFPSLRGGNNNPGVKEGFLGEIDDVLAAADFLAKQTYVDPTHIYLGGHSTGGTLVLLVAECTDRFRAVISFGPVDYIAGYGAEMLPFNLNDQQETEARSPAQWVFMIKGPTFAFEGADEGNGRALTVLGSLARSPIFKTYLIPGANHFSVLGPTNRAIAGKILLDVGPTCNLDFDLNELKKPFAK